LENFSSWEGWQATRFPSILLLTEPFCALGQLADIEATDKFANDRRENGDDLTATPFLFRKCCIAVSWSRYMAVAMQYGAPQSKKESIASDAEQDIQTQSTSSENDEQVGAPVHQSDAVVRDDIDTEQKMVFDASSETASGIHASLASSSSEEDPVKQPPTNTLTGWVQKQRQAMKDNKKKKLKTDPNEGILHLDKPLLLCQEIYDKIVGNHQTSVLSKKQAIDLLRKDIEQHKNDADINGDSHAFLADQDWIFAQLNESNGDQQASQEESNHQIAKQSQGSMDTNDDGLIDSVGKRQKDDRDMNSEKGAPGEQRSPTTAVDNTISHPGNADEEKKEENEQLEGSTSRLWNRGFNSQKSKVNDQEIEKGSDLDEDGIIGYFKWENSLFSQEIKMHLAEGSDLALHVVLAIIANQVRYERNAIAMMV
jgi:hypothetical protein